MLFLAAGLLPLGSSIRMSFCNDIWYDELFTMGLIQHSYGSLTAFTAQDVHPPLYYYIVKLSVYLCKLIMPEINAVIVAKIVSVLPYFLLLFYTIFFLRKRFGLFPAGLFFFCILAMPQMSAYTVEIRMYSWALFFVTAAYFHAYELMRKQKGKSWYLHGVLFVCYGLAAAYTQYFACIAVIMLYLCLLLWFIYRYMYNKKKNNTTKPLIRTDSETGGVWRICAWFIGAAISVIGYLPWLFVLYRQMSMIKENYWILPLTWRSLGGCVKYIFLPGNMAGWPGVVVAAAFAGLYGIFFLYLCFKACREQNMLCIYAILGVFVLAGLVLFGFAASFLFRPIFIYRYMTPALGCFWFTFALGLDVFIGEDVFQTDLITQILEVRSPVFRVIGAVACIFVFLTGLKDYRSFLGEEKYKASLMEETVAALDGIGEDDILIFNFDQIQMVTGYYINNDSYLWYGEPEKLIQEICSEKESLNEDMNQIREWLLAGEKVWFLGSFNSREDILALWRQEGIVSKEQGSYLLERYWFNLYELSLDMKQ